MVKKWLYVKKNNQIILLQNRILKKFGNVFL